MHTCPFYMISWEVKSNCIPWGILKSPLDQSFSCNLVWWREVLDVHVAWTAGDKIGVMWTNTNGGTWVYFTCVACHLSNKTLWEFDSWYTQPIIGTQLVCVGTISISSWTIVWDCFALTIFHTDNISLMFLWDPSSSQNTLWNFIISLELWLCIYWFTRPPFSTASSFNGKQAGDSHSLSLIFLGRG